MLLANRIKKVRESSKINRHELAKGIISYSHLCNVEAGRFEPSEEILIALAKKLKVPPEYFLKYKENDEFLEELLLLLKNNLDNEELKEAEKIFNIISQEYPLINSLYLETFFYMLKSYYLYKSKQWQKAILLMKNEVYPLVQNVNIELQPTDFREVYYYLEGIIYYFDEVYHMSYQSFIKYLTLVKNNILKAVANYNIALMLYNIGSFHNALAYAKEALNICLHERQWEKAAEADNLLGALYLEINDFDRAERHLLNSLEISAKYQLEYIKTQLFHNLGLTYMNKLDINKSLEYFNLSIKLKKELNYKELLFMTYHSILDIYIKQDMLEESVALIAEAKEFCKNSGEQYLLKAVEANLNLKLNKPAVYELYMVETLNYFVENKKWRYVVQHSEKLADFYYISKRYKRASYYYKLAVDANKKIYKEDEYEKG